MDTFRLPILAQVQIVLWGLALFSSHIWVFELWLAISVPSLLPTQALTLSVSTDIESPYYLLFLVVFPRLTTVIPWYSFGILFLWFSVPEKSVPGRQVDSICCHVLSYTAV